MCVTGQCEPFVLEGFEAMDFDRDSLAEYNKELGSILIIEYGHDKITVSFPDNMDEHDKNNTHLILEESFGFK